VDSSLSSNEVAFAGVIGQRALLREGRISAVELLALCLARNARYDGGLNAFRTLFPDAARTAAAAADEAIAAGEDRPLLGVPVAIKDNVAVAGHAAAMGTGSPEPVARSDAELVRRLRAAEAVIVGTTHLPELALWPFTESQTWGVTRNPWDLRRTPGGSSGGSGAAVAAGLVAVATASDGGGSIRIPAAACGLVGLKPTRGRVPLGLPGETDLEHWYGLSSAGVLTRTVADTALVLSVLTAGAVGEIPETRPLRIRWTTRAPMPTTVAPAQLAALEATVELLHGLGHDVAQADPDYGRVQASFLPRYARGVAQDLAALVDPSATESRTRATAALGRRMPDALLAKALAWGEQAARQLAVLPDGADVLLTPVLAAPPARTGALSGLRTLAGAGRVVPFTPAWNVTGQPAMSVPAGFAAGLPTAVQLIAPPHQEGRLLALAAQLEAATGFSNAVPELTGESDLA